MASYTYLDVRMSGKKEDIDQVLDQIMKNNTEIDARKFSRIEDRIPLEQWPPELTFYSSSYVRPDPQGNNGYFGGEKYNQYMTDDVWDLSEQHPNVTFVCVESRDFYLLEVTYKNGKQSDYFCEA